MSDFIAIDNKYDISQSNTSKPWSDPDGTQKKQRVDLGTVVYDGPVYNESMCLIHTGYKADIKDAKLCVQNIPFILAKIDQDQNSPQGVLGLAKGKNRLTYINLLKDQKVI